MPYDYMGRSWSDEQMRLARGEGLAGAVAGIAGTDNWLDFFQGLGRGYRGGVQGSLADSYRRELWEEEEEKKRLLEEEKQARARAEEAAAQERSRFYLDQIPDEFEGGLMPETAFTEPGQRATYLGGEAKRFEEEAEIEEASTRTREMLTRYGIDPTGDADLDRKLLEKAATQAIEPPDTLSPSEQLAWTRFNEEQEDEETKELDDAYTAGRRYAQLTPEEQATVPKPYGSRVSGGTLADSYGEMIERRQQVESDAKIAERLRGMGVEPTDDPKWNADVAKSLTVKMPPKTTPPPPGTTPRVTAPGTPPPTPKPQPPPAQSEVPGPAGPRQNVAIAPGMPKAGEPKAAQPTNSIPTSTAPPVQRVEKNPADLDDAGLRSVFVRSGVAENRVEELLRASPELGAAFRQAWMKAGSQAERAAVERQLAEAIAAAGWRQ